MIWRDLLFIHVLPKFISGHLSTLRTCTGNPVALPYLIWLQQLQEILDSWSWSTVHYQIRKNSQIFWPEACQTTATKPESQCLCWTVYQICQRRMSQLPDSHIGTTVAACIIWVNWILSSRTYTSRYKQNHCAKVPGESGRNCHYRAARWTLKIISPQSRLKMDW